ncbi:CUB and sushi domain-containing protein 1-like [Mercenaria mercenaria]|uniref:CUB and sushi domain-containing protein 1-like n=1 Tax=Mercenaria mercenaria TaxID=6596 RepID=UPI00234E9C66|nr:CUB and sushi domain-containing protein 1-like [Mercenaria mercenaria]
MKNILFIFVFVIIFIWIKPSGAQELNCTDPTPSDGSALLPGGLLHGSFAQISCDQGFTLNGDSIILCFNGTWSTDTTCDIIDCGDPTPTYGLSNHTSTTYQSTAGISCNVGYNLQGSSFIECQSDSTWSDSPTCQPHDCGTITLTDGSVNTPGGTTYNQEATLSCNTGYTLNGPSVVECLVSGWNDSSTCDIVVCGNPTPTNGVADAPAGFTYGKMAVISCNTGHTLSGDTLIICQANGTWSDSPTCEINDCGTVTPADGIANGSSTTYGTVLSIECNTGYVLSGATVTECQANSEWTDEPLCNPNDCGVAAPANGQASTPLGTTYTQEAAISCDPGYDLDGPSVLVCTETAWNDTVTCVIQDCGDPAPDNGSAVIPVATTYGEVAIISCDTGFTLNGVNFITCEDGATWSSTPTCEINDCGDLTPQNGSRSAGPTTYTSSLTIACDTGFDLVGSASITCQADSTWTEYPTCDPKDCGTLIVVNGQFTAASGTTLGETATQSCNTGYTLAGDATVTCTDSGWNSSAATCTIVDCMTPTIINGETAETPRGTTYGEIAIMACAGGYTLNGNAFVTCQADGSWTTLPACDIRNCGDPTPSAGTSNDTNYEYGTAIQVTCNSGYTIQGSSSIICQADGTWSDSPTCDPEDCGTLTVVNGQFTAASGTTLGETATQSCNTGYTLAGDATVTCTDSGWNSSAATCTIVDCMTPTIINGETAETPRGTTYGEIAIMACADGYTLDGNAFVTCQANGSWTTLPTCDIRNCGDPTPSAGTSNDTNYEYGTAIQVTCNSGYTIQGSSSIICQADGTWSDSPTCDPEDCGTLIVVNGQFTAASGTTMGETATQSCNTGYTLAGDATVTCTDSGWNSSAATCTIVDCMTPTIINGEISETPRGTTYGEIAIMACADGYTLDGNAFVTCQADGSWTTLPTCDIRNCGDPTPSAGTSNDTNYEYGTAIQVTCNSGYTIQGSSSIFCQADGTWSDSPTCDPEDCGTLTVVNGQFTVASGTTLGETATQSCNTGYTLAGDATVTCTGSGWNRSAATCTIVDCMTPTIINGETAETPRGTTYGEIAIMACAGGYTLNGNAFVTCQADGSWTTLPTCDIRNCGDPTPSAGTSNDTNYEYGTAIQVSCNSGYTIQGSSSIICQADGTWSDSPTCDPEDCGTLTVVNGQFTAASGTTLGETATQSCNTGYTLAGDATVTCTDSGWNSSAATCTIVDCMTPTIINGETAETPRGTTYGEIAIMACADGYTLDGNAFVTCQANGSWTTLPTCGIRVCDDPVLSNGDVNTTARAYGTVISVSCEDGYTLQGSEIIVCKSDATWSDYPTCEPIDCGDPMPSGGAATILSGTTYGMNATVTCNQGYNLTGSSYITCDVTGWSDTPTCTVQDCGELSPGNGSVITPEGTTYGSMAAVTCHDGYVLVGDIILRCQAGPHWSSYPVCIKDCGDPSPENGKASTLSGTTLDQTATITCNEGYALDGSSSIKCLETGWNDTTTCVIKECDDPSPDNGVALTPEGTQFGDTAFVTCNEGFTLEGSGFISCGYNGSWSSYPTCTIKDCSDPVPYKGTANDSSTTYGSVIEIICDTGHVISGSSVITCNADGTWSDVPTCDPDDCGNPTPANGYADLTYGTTYNSNVTVTCDTGYNLTGFSVLYCLETGWSDTPSCNIQECEDPTPLNGNSEQTRGTTFGSVVIVNCNDGYQLVGHTHIYCDAGPIWSSTPTCIKDCGDPTPNNGFANIPSGTTFSETATITCSPGYNLNGSSTLTCQQSGWDDTPTCYIQDCGDPPLGNGTANTPTGTTYGEVAFISCNEGYTLQGEEHITCEDGGSWSSTPACIIIDCGDPAPTNGQSDTPEGTTLGSVAGVSCNDGYILSGDAILTCEAGPIWSDDSTCIRDCGSPVVENGNVDSQAGTLFGQSVTVTCNEGYDISGASTWTCVDSGWNATASCVIQDCGDPVPTNGQSDTPEGTTLGSVAGVSCNDGYVLSGDAILTCEAGPQWSDNSTCIRDCGSPVVENGNVDASSGTLFGQSVLVTCNEGFDISGASTWTCVDSGWNATASCVIQDCGNPAFENGIARTPTGTTFGEVAFISCNESYTLQGDEHITCEDGGSWSSTPSCISIDCGDPAPTNGNSDTPEGTTLGSVAGVSCKDGYILSGDAILTCEAGPQWSDNSACVRDCGIPSVTNGAVDYSSGTLFGTTVTVTCYIGYNRTGASTWACVDSGWNDTTTCVIQDCGDPSPTDGVAKVPTGTTYGEVAFISCNEGYILQGEEHITCEEGEIWSSYPSCIKDCGDATPVNGEASYSAGTTLGETATVTCNSGYDLTGLSSLTCTDSGWDDTPICVIQNCGDPALANGTANTPTGTTYGEVAFISCNEGYTLQGDEHITCEDGGSWSSSPTCVSIDCGDPAPTNGQSDTPEGTTLGSVAGVSCNDGYVLSGDAILTCETGPKWSDSPTCVRDCGSPVVENGNVDASSGTLFGQSVLVTCNEGFDISGASTWTCVDSGWNATASCVIQDCGNPPLENGIAKTPTGTAYGEVAFIHCNEGYTLQGDEHITCGAGGSWSSTPTCISIDCGDPAPFNGQSDTPEGTTLGSVAGVSCNDGYVLSGDAILTCETGSIWSDDPTCIKDCGDPAPSNGGASTVSGTTLGETATVTCDSGYDLTGSSTLTCTDSGWDGTPICVIQVCEDPTPANGYAQLPTGRTFGSSVFLSCATDYTLMGDSLIVCLNGGVWSDTPSCVKNSELPDATTQTPAQEDNTFNFETTLIFGLLLGLVVLVAIISAGVFIYLKRCRQPANKHEVIDESEFRRSAIHDGYPDDFDDDDLNYPPILLAHPPPSSREAVPPLQFTQKGNVNIVPPMTKKEKPPEDVKKALGAAAVLPTPPKPVNGKNKKGLPPVPDDVRKMHESQPKSSPRIPSVTDALPQNAEITAPVNEFESTDNSRQVKMTALNKDLQQTISNEKSGAIPKAQKSVTKPTGLKNKPPQKKDDKKVVDLKRKVPPSKSKQEINIAIKPVTTVKTKPLKESSKPVTKDIEQDKSKENIPTDLKSDETVIDIEGERQEDKPKSSVPIPTIDIEQCTPRKESQSKETEDQSNTAGKNKKDALLSAREKASSESGERTERNQSFLVKNETKNDQKDLDAFFDADSTTDKAESLNDQKRDEPRDDNLELQSISTSQSPYKEMHHLLPPVPHLHNQFDPVKSRNSPESPKVGSTGQHHMHSNVANISSNAMPIMPSVESVIPTETSPASSEKAGDSDTHVETLHDGDNTDSLTSNSEVDIPSPPPKPTKQFIFDPEPTPGIFKKSLHRSDHTDTFYGVDPHEESSPNKHVIRPGRSTGPAKSAASSRLLKSSYGTKPKEALTVYNPAIAKKEIDPKIKDIEHNKREKERKELEKMRKIRMGAISAAYGSISPTKGMKKK